MSGNSADFSVVVHSNQNHAAGGVGESADFRPKAGCAGKFELSGETFAESDKVGERGAGVSSVKKLMRSTGNAIIGACYLWDISIFNKEQTDSLMFTPLPAAAG
ncbi:MAG: hypothetical protein OXU71_05855 [Gammaproteobacteria bacterium]|nr:hypothetical protein [Gammaproteobacteria bacterium]